MRKPKPTRTAPTDAALILRLEGTDYQMKRVGRDWLIRKPDGTTYAVARTRSGVACDCPRARYTAEPLRCKHIVALESVGIVDG